MIFDGHAYCFPSLKGDGGFSDPNQFRKHLQQSIGSHHQPVWRLNDRTRGNNSQLLDTNNSTSLSSLKEINFHAGSFGRFEWTHNEEIYVKQYIPPSNEDMSYPSDRLIAEMDYAGVDKCMLHRTPFLGIGNDFIADCIKRFPNRLYGLAHTEEWLIEDDPDAAFAKIEKAIKEDGFSGFQFLPLMLNLYDNKASWDQPSFIPFWDQIAKLEVPVYLSLSPRETSYKLSGHKESWDNYHEELKTLMRWMDRYPDVKVVQTHGLDWRSFVDGDTIALPDEVWAPFDNPNLYLQLLFPICLGNIWDYPMPQIRPTIEECVKRIGANRLIWGTDMPMVSRFWTYKQNIDFIRLYCDFLDESEINHILGNTIAKLHGLLPAD